MLAGLTILLLFQCAGEVIVHALGLPFPGPVLGMLLLFLALALRGGVPKDLALRAVGLPFGEPAPRAHADARRVPAGVLRLCAGEVQSAGEPGVASTLALAAVFDLPMATKISLSVRSVTAPIAMGIAEKAGGVPALAAVFAIATGIIGAVSARFVLDACRILEPAARGFATGLAAHGIGTARAYQVSEVMGAFAGLALGLHGLVASFLLPAFLRWFAGAA